MKFVITLCLSLGLACHGFGQEAAELSPAERLRIYPPFSLLLADSLTFYKKDMLPAKKPVLLMVFNPSCDHCKHVTEELLKNHDAFKDIHLVLATTAPLEEMRAFMATYKLDSYPDIVVGQDTQFMLPSFYRMRNFPLLAAYDKKHQLIEAHEGSLPISKLLANFGK